MSGRLPDLEKRRLKFVAEVIMGQSPPPESINHDGNGLPFLQGCSEFGSVHPTPEKFSVSAPKRSVAGDWLMSVRAPVGKLNHADMDYGIGRGLCAVRAIAGVSEPRFLGYALAAAVPELQSHATGSTYDAVAIEDVANMVIGVPSPAEQCAIADFLDREVAKIDALIDRTTAFAATLEDARRARLDRAVSAGLNRDVPMRLSGVAWWPEIPAHWMVKPLKFLVKPSRYITYGIVQAGPDVADGVPYIRTSDLSGDELPLTGYLKTSHEIDNSYRRSRVAAGELVIAIRATVGKTLKVPPELDGANLTQGTARISPNSDTSSEYLLHVLNSPAARSGFMSMAKGATFKEITLEMLRNFPVPVPPLSEQAEITRAMNAQATRYRRAFALVEEQRQRLLEHRSALITAAVTGQIAFEGVSTPAANDNRQALCAVIGAEIVSRHASAKSFGRVKLQKLLYLAEVHTGVHELSGNYVREAAGPLARDLLSETERGMAAEGFFRTIPPTRDGEGYIYSQIGKAGGQREQFAKMLGARAEPLRQLIDLLKGFDTLTVEAITTLYAVWNDALLDGEQPGDDRLVRGVLNEWHHEKKAKFKPADLKHWLAWMHRNGLVPSGRGPRTHSDQLFV